MKLSSLQENLHQGLSVVAHVAGKNINLPILNNIMIKADNGNIKLITTDLEVGVVSGIRGKIETPGAFTVNSKITTDYIGLLPNKKVSIEHKNNELIIRCDNHSTKIKGQSAEEFPLIPQIDKKTYYRADLLEFKKALTQVVFAVSNSQTRLELTGVLFNFNQEKMILAATDSYRLAEKTINTKTSVSEKNNGNKNVIVPAKTLQELVRILSSIKESETVSETREIRFYISGAQILFTIGATEVISRLIEGQYPDYRQIIPTNPKTKAIVNKAELIRAVKAAALFSKIGINDINLDFPKNKNQIVISSASGQTGENITELGARVKGEDNGVVVNYRYLLDGLNNLESEDIIIEIIDGNTPCIIKSEKQTNYLYVVMPIKQ